MEKINFSTGIIDDSSRKKLIKKLSSNEEILKLLRDKNIPEEEIELHPYKLNRYLEAKKQCLNCLGLKHCKQKQKGYYESLSYHSVLEDELVRCDYALEKDKAEKHLKYYLIRDLGNDFTTAFFDKINLKNEDKRIERDNKDQKNFDLILKAYKFKKRKKGARQIMMVLDNEFNVHFNLKKIRRLMKKFGLKCPIRQANPYRRMMKATQEHTTCENIINRVFKTGIPYNILLTDITYLFYGDNKKCYLSTIKDAETNEILTYYISENMTLDISLETVKKLHRKKNIILNENVIIHSDQGVHYTSPKFHNLLKKYNIQQSMSRRGNCWDNAPQESYFGHMKDELNLDTCFTFRDVCNEIKDYIEYYNNYRYQWDLKKMTPVQYRNHLFASNV